MIEFLCYFLCNSVKRKGDILPEITGGSDGTNSLEEIEIVENQPLLPGVNLLANGEFDKETGGYESESEEDKPEPLEDVLNVEDTQKDKKVSKKRKASNKIQSSKYVLRSELEIYSFPFPYLILLNGF